MPLPINIEELIRGRIVENDRIEYKKGWNPGSIYRSICAFANDFEDIGGGYIIIGIDELNGRPILPPVGVDEEQIDKIQREMVGFNNLIRPVYFPKVSIEEVLGKKIVVIWAISGDARPYEVPEEIKSKNKQYHYYIRALSSTVKANKQQREELINLANKVPFDDRPNPNASLDDISFVLVKEHLRLIKSRLLGWVESQPKVDILSNMELLSGPPENRMVRNVALMMFSENPELFYPYSRVEIVHFPNGEDGKEFVEAPNISGPVPYMIRQTLLYLKTAVLEEKITKLPDRPEAMRVWNYPYTAIEEIVANALYHRDYQTREPVEIRIYPEFIVFLNYGGPSSRIESTISTKKSNFSRRYRNRRLGDFLKELELTEGKATGIPIIKKALLDNGSPQPEFDTDEDRSYFQVIVRIHPSFSIQNEGVNQENEGVNQESEGVNQGSEGVNQRNEGVNQDSEGVDSLLQIIKKSPGYRNPYYAAHLQLPEKTTERWLNTLRKKGVIEFRGSFKRGGYWLKNGS